MKLLSSLTSDSFDHFIDFDVVDQNRESVGTVDALWADHVTGKLDFLGVKTGWIFGSNHVVPAEQAQIDEETRTIQVPYAAELIKDAPTIGADEEISDEQEIEILRYYGIRRGTAAPAAPQAAAGAKTGLNAAIAATSARLGGAPAPTAPQTAPTPSVASTATTRDARVGENIEVPLSEEQLKVGKRTVETGSVRLRKIIRTEQVQVPVELRREDFVVERIEAKDVKPGDAKAFDEKAIDMTLHREEAVVGKETVVTGAVRVRKTEDVETKTVSDSVRKEDVEVLRDGKADVRRDDQARR